MLAKVIMNSDKKCRFEAPSFINYISDLAIMFEMYPTQNDQELRDVRKCMKLIDELETTAKKLPKIRQEIDGGNS